MKKIIPVIFVISALFIGCGIETGYRHDVKPVIEDYNKVIIAFQMFVQTDHRGREVEAEHDLADMFSLLTDAKKRCQEVNKPQNPNQADFHSSFILSLQHLLNVIEAYKDKFRVQIQINVLEDENADLQKNLEIVQRNFNTAMTARGKNTYRDKLMSLRSSLDTSKKNLETTQETYAKNLIKLMSFEEFYLNKYDKIVQKGKTSALISLAPGPKWLVSLEEKNKYYPQQETEE